MFNWNIQHGNESSAAVMPKQTLIPFDVDFSLNLRFLEAEIGHSLNILQKELSSVLTSLSCCFHYHAGYSNSVF